jgi:hypothetical protein
MGHLKVNLSIMALRHEDDSLSAIAIAMISSQIIRLRAGESH